MQPTAEPRCLREVKTHAQPRSCLDFRHLIGYGLDSACLVIDFSQSRPFSVGFQHHALECSLADQ